VHAFDRKQRLQRRLVDHEKDRRSWHVIFGGVGLGTGWQIAAIDQRRHRRRPHRGEFDISREGDSGTNAGDAYAALEHEILVLRVVAEQGDGAVRCAGIDRRLDGSLCLTSSSSKSSC
jgi:hypothetical protein